jgi:hypothetical protein
LGESRFEPDADLSVPLTVYYPRLEGSVEDAPILTHCGRYALILFLHGHCQTESNHRYRWERTLAQLARCGFVVAAPYLASIVDAFRQQARTVQLHEFARIAAIGLDPLARLTWN